ncbi:MAG: hypothetical protein V1685_06485 [Parcubacteria group bacterium]
MRVFLSGTIGLTLVIIAGLLGGIGLWYAGELIIESSNTEDVDRNAATVAELENSPPWMPDLIFATKEGTNVTVFSRNGETQDDTELFSYEERVPATKSGNLWEGLPPSVALSHDGKSIAYAKADGVYIGNLQTDESRAIISKTADPAPDDLLEIPKWDVDPAIDAYGFAIPHWSADDNFIGISTTHWEGSSLSIRGVSGDSFASAGSVGGNIYFQWSPVANQYVLPTYGAYAKPGLYVGSGTDVEAVDIMKDNGVGFADYYEAQFSPDGTRIVFTYEPYGVEGPQEGGIRKIGVVSPDGSNFVTLPYDGKLMAPFFGPDGSDIYFAAESEPDIILRRHDLRSDTLTDMLRLPDTYNTWRFREWTERRYALLEGVEMSQPGVEAGDRAELFAFHVESGVAVWQSGPFDAFVTFAGLVE